MTVGVETPNELMVVFSNTISAGFDAHAADPLAQLNWTEADFAAVTALIRDAARAAGAPVVSVLEGGYDLAALGRSARVHVETLKEAAQ